MSKGIQGFQKGHKYGYKPCKEEIKERFSKDRKENKNPNWKGGKRIVSVCQVCGKSFSDYIHRKCCSIDCGHKLVGQKNSIRMKGLCEEKTPNWQGGKTKIKKERTLKKYADWRMDIFIRDDFTCQLCEKVGKKLNAHHIKEWAKYPELRYEVSNGITLCYECHKEIHKKYGKKI